jgi:hypothetical protein
LWWGKKWGEEKVRLEVLLIKTENYVEDMGEVKWNAFGVWRWEVSFWPFLTAGVRNKKEGERRFIFYFLFFIFYFLFFVVAA